MTHRDDVQLASDRHSCFVLHKVFLCALPGLQRSSHARVSADGRASLQLEGIERSLGRHRLSMDGISRTVPRQLLERRSPMPTLPPHPVPRFAFPSSFSDIVPSFTEVLQGQLFIDLREDYHSARPELFQRIIDAATSSLTQNPKTNSSDTTVTKTAKQPEIRQTTSSRL